MVVSEAEDGTVTMRINGRVLAARLYPKDHAQLDPGVVVVHKHLDGVFAFIAAQQQQRDAARLASPKLTRREKDRLHAGSAPAGPRPVTRVKRTSLLGAGADTSTLC